MLINDVQKDVKKLCIDNDMSFKKLADESGTSKQYVSRLLSNGIPVNQMIIKLVEQLGYDIRIEYIKRSEEK